MKAYKDFIVSPIGERYNNSKKINGKELICEVEFQIGRKEYKVIRGAKPNKFELYVD